MSDLLDKITSRFDANRIVPLEMPEWEETIYVRKLSIAEEFRLNSETNHARHAARIAIQCVVDEKGNQRFTDDVETLAALQSKTTLAEMNRIASVARGATKEQAKNG